MGRRRLGVLVTVLGGVLVLWGVSYAQARSLERELRLIARVLEYENQERLEELVTRPVRVTSVVIAAKDYLVFGQAVGKISVYMLVEDSGGNKKYHGVEYHYLKTDKAWTLTDSSSHGHNDSTEPARLAFGEPRH
jgi:hypothetical protein